MRMVQYPKVISIHSFRVPNFTLVSELLRWMIQRYDPDIDIYHSIDTENDRVLFITSIVKGFYQRTKMKLNPVRLYAADGHAVKELLKLATFLHQSVFNFDNESRTINDQGLPSRTSSTSYLQYNSSINNQNISLSSFDLTNLDEMKELRKLASEVTEKSAKLYELLQKEVENHTSQQQEHGLKFLDAISTGFDDSPELQHIESVLMSNLQLKKNEASNLERECRELESDRRDLVEEIKRKTIDLERNKNRLESIEKARPAFMDEYESLEEELQRHYDLYMERYRNVHYLRSEMEKFQKQDDENEKLQRHTRAKKKMQSQLKNEQLNVLRGGGNNAKEKYERLDTEEGNHDDEEEVPILDGADDSAIIIDGDDEDMTNNEIFVGEDDDEHLSLDDESSSGLLLSHQSKEDSSAGRESQLLSTSKNSSSFSINSEGSDEMGNISNEVGRSSNNSIDSDEIF